MDRMDLFGTVHKGLRASLSSVAGQIGRTDFHEAEAAARAIAATRRLVGLLDEHAEHEDRVILPEIEALGPALFADLQADHNRVDGLQREVEGLLDRLAASDENERAALGRRLHERINRLAAEHLLHMEREETAASRLLWAHRSDDELRAMQGRILGSIPPERMRQWAEIMLPAINAQERALLMKGLSRSLPPEAFEELAALAG